MTAAVRLAAFDTEDDSAGNPELFALVWEGGARYTDSADTFLENLLLLASESDVPLQVWATNLEYDAVNVWGAERMAEVSLKFGKSALYGARWRKIEFRDTMRFIPASVKVLGELVGLPKVLPMRTRSEKIRRCVRDATITYRAARLIHDTMQAFGEKPRLTLPATAYRIWSEHFWKKPVRAPLEEVRDAASEAYHGGRVEPFALGCFKDVRAVDAASMFPWAMTVRPFPIPWGLWRRAMRDAVPGANGLYRARLESALDVPALPYRSERGTIFPNGRWEGWYVGEELMAFGAAGGRVRVMEGFDFMEKAHPFRPYVKEMFHRKQTSRGPMRETYKLLLNSLYGKFGQSGIRVRALPLAKFLKLKSAPVSYRVWGGLAIWTEESTPPPWANMLWAAITTARARVRLRAEIVRIQARGARPLYCDTDSVIYAGPPGRYPLKARQIGDFERRGAYRSALIVGKKEYGLESSAGMWEIHVKGVPAAHREEYLRSGEAAYQLPTKMREAARTGRQANVWREVRKRRRVGDGGRVRMPDGTLIPLEISG